MTHIKTIKEILKFLFYNSKDLITNNVSFFIILNILHLFIVVFFALINELLGNNIDIFQLRPGILLLRVSIFALMMGVYIGYFKLILNFIDKQIAQSSLLIKYFYLLPKLLFLRFLSYITMIPIVWYIFQHFPYNMQEYGTNYEQYLLDLIQRISSGLSLEDITTIYQGMTNTYNIYVMIILLLIPIWYTIRFWTAEFLIIDQEYTIKDALIISFKITNNSFHLICLSIILIFWSLLTLLLGFIIFLVGLTFSYLFIVLYYRLLLKKISN